MTSLQFSGRLGAASPSLHAYGPWLLCLLMPCAQAARPLITDDARITDGKSCQVESWIRNNPNSTEYWALPACNFTGTLELTAGGARTHTEAQTYLSDFVLQGKTVLKSLEPNGWGVGLTAGTVSHRHVRDAGRDWYATVPTSFSFQDDRVVLHANLGWLREQTQRTRATWGMGTEIALDESNWLIAETFGQNQGKPNYQLGLRRWLVPGHMQIDATYGKRLGGTADEHWFSIGLRVLSAPFLP